MTTAREIIARHLCTMAAQGWSAISPFERAAYRTTAAGMVEAVTAAGFRIVGPEDVDPVTVEKCAEVANAEAAKHQGPFTSQPAYVAACTIRDALRALKEKQG